MHINQEGKQIKTDEIFVEIEVYNNNSVENPENTQIKKFWIEIISKNIKKK